MVAKVLWEEELSDVADRMVARFAGRLAAPTLLAYEVVNVIRSTRALAPGDRKAALAALHGLRIRLHPPVPDLVASALEDAERHGISVYDASYVALARLLDAPLLTADDRLVRKVRDLRVVALRDDPPEDA